MSNNRSGRRKRKNKNRGSLDPDRSVINGEMVRGFPQMIEHGSIPTIQNEFPDNNMASIPTYPSYIKQEIPESYDFANFEDPFGCDSYLEDIKPELPMLTDGIHSSYFNELEVPTQQCKVDPNDIITIYKCCNIKFYDKFLHFRHMIDHLEKDLMRASCQCCHRTFKTRADMLRHAKSAHIGFKCRKCALIFPKKYFLVHHMEITHPGYHRRMNYNYQPKKHHWHKKVKKFASYETKGIKSETPETKIKIEKNNETGLENVKMESDISNIKQEPMSFNIKMEPMSFNIKMEPMCLNIKQEPTY